MPPALTDAHFSVGVHGVAHPPPLARVPVVAAVRVRVRRPGERLVLVVAPVVAVRARCEVLVGLLVAAPVFVQQAILRRTVPRLVRLPGSLLSRVEVGLLGEDVAPGGIRRVQLEVKVRVEGVKSIHPRVAQRAEPLVGDILGSHLGYHAVLVERAVAVPVADEDVVVVVGVAVAARRAHHVLDIHLAGVLLDVALEAELAGVHVDAAEQLADLDLAVEDLDLRLAYLVRGAELLAAAGGDADGWI